MRSPTRQNYLKEYHSAVPWDGTLYLHQLQQELRGAPSNTQASAAIRAALSSICSYSDDDLPDSFVLIIFLSNMALLAVACILNRYIYSLETTWTKQVTEFDWAAPPVYVLNPH